MDLPEILALEGLSADEIHSHAPGAIICPLGAHSEYEGFFSYRRFPYGVSLDHFVIAREFRNTSAGARLWRQMRKHFRSMGIHEVYLSIKTHQPKLSLFLQHVLHARPYRIDEGCVDMILEV